MKRMPFHTTALLRRFAAGCFLVAGMLSCSAPQATFTNPLRDGADPWITKYDGRYYTCFKSGRGIAVTESDDMTRFERERVVWQPADSGAWNSFNIWAPELHRLRGKWYIYYAAAPVPGSPFTGQRTGVLECDTPLGDYRDRGMLYTGDDPDGKTDNIWAIDMTIFEHRGELYAVWSGWERQRDTDATDQLLYIARMESPTRIGPRILLSRPDQPWEQGDHISLQEGPSALRHGDDLFIVYSTRGSWSRHYKLGQLRLRTPDSDPLNPASWIKSGPVFTGNDRIHGVGHASFTTSPDGREHWIYYHSKKDTVHNWGRDVRLQRFDFDATGNPRFGAARRAGALPHALGDTQTRELICPNYTIFSGNTRTSPQTRATSGLIPSFSPCAARRSTATASRRRRWTKARPMPSWTTRQPSPTSVWCWSATRSGRCRSWHANTAAGWRSRYSPYRAATARPRPRSW